MSTAIEKTVMIREFLVKARMSDPYDKLKDDYATGDGPPPYPGFGKHDEPPDHVLEAAIERHREQRDVKKGVPEEHQRKIAQQTRNMPDAMVGVMGGMNKEQAKKILHRKQ